MNEPRQRYVACYPDGRFVAGLSDYVCLNRNWIERAVPEAVREEVRHLRLHTVDLQRADFFDGEMQEMFRKCLSEVQFLPAEVRLMQQGLAAT